MGRVISEISAGNLKQEQPIMFYHCVLHLTEFIHNLDIQTLAQDRLTVGPMVEYQIQAIYKIITTPV